jgi:hypothetical protein
MPVSSRAVSRVARAATPRRPRRHPRRIFAKRPAAPSAMSPDGPPRRRFPTALEVRSRRECPRDPRCARSRRARPPPLGPRVARDFRAARTREPPPRPSLVWRGGLRARSVHPAEPIPRHSGWQSHRAEPSAAGSASATPEARRRQRRPLAGAIGRTPKGARLGLAHSCCVGEWLAKVARRKVLGPNRADVTHCTCYPCTRSGGSLLSSFWRPRCRSS